ncbi:MAG: hypothetical protein FWD29_00710 [Micrococcales bacterium]|nr:hypothetical protein [Micrococcales bacterium]
MLSNPGLAEMAMVRNPGLAEVSQRLGDEAAQARQPASAINTHPGQTQMD